MSFFSNTKADLLNILATDGEVLTYTSRDGGSSVVFKSVIHRDGEDGSGVVNIPVADVTSPVFADKVVDEDAVIWYVTQTRETLQGRTFCDIKLSTHWQTVDIEEFAAGSWGTHTASVLMLLNVNSSFEEFDEFGARSNEYTGQIRYLSDPGQRMRIKWGTRYLYITGIRPDETFSQWMELDLREDEA